MMTVDIHDKLKAEFFNEADILFWLWDKDLNLIEVNDATLKTFGFKREDVIGKNISEISPDAIPSGRFDIYMEVIRTGKTFTIDEVKAHPSLGNLHFRLKAFKVGEGLGSITKDITDLKETIDELETFIYQSSHDMRGPVASILGLVNLSESEVSNIQEARQFCKIVRQQTERLDSILKVLVDTTRIRSGEKNIRLINFNQLLEEVFKSLEFFKGYNQIRFEQRVAVEQKFYSDKNLLVLILQNLIDNAIKYRKANVAESFANISIEDEDDGVKICVSDNGIGIPEHLQNDVYKMFFRATNQATGSGLGLYTVKQTVKSLGGRIILESEDKVGTSFRVYVPNEMVNMMSKL